MTREELDRAFSMLHNLQVAAEDYASGIRFALRQIKESESLAEETMETRQALELVQKQESLMDEMKLLKKRLKEMG